MSRSALEQRVLELQAENSALWHTADEAKHAEQLARASNEDAWRLLKMLRGTSFTSATSSSSSAS